MIALQIVQAASLHSLKLVFAQHWSVTGIQTRDGRAARPCQPLQIIQSAHFFPPQFFTCFSKNYFSPDPPFFFPISLNTALTKTLTYPSTLGGILHDVP